MTAVMRHDLPEAEYCSGEELYLAALGMDMQWFASPEDEGRTHDPTEATYRRAREEGRVAKSQDVNSAIGLLLPGLAVIFLAPWILRTCTEMLRFFFTRVNELDPLTDGITARLFLNYFIRMAVPILIVAMVSAILSNLIQFGFLFSTKPLEPDFSKVLPKFGQYFGRIFSLEGVVNFLKSVFKLFFIGLVAFILIRSKFWELANLQKAELWSSITLIATLAAQLLIIVAIILLVLSIPDYVFQRYQFKQSLKMTREKLKEEMKQDEGDPDIKRRLKQRYRELLSSNMLQAVPKADVVITNPTHYSVALEYDMNRMDAPMVVAKGEDELAFRIREVAEANNVPVVSHPPLTRAIYHETEVGDPIPLKYWKLVAMVVGRFLYHEQKQGTETGKMGA